MEIFADYRFLALSCYSIGVLCLFLATLVLKANPNARGCQLTFCLNLFVALWAFSFGSMLIATNEMWGLWAAKSLTVTINFLNAFFFHLVVFVTKKEKSWKKLLILNYAVASILSLATLFTSLIIQGSPPKLDYPSYIEGGPFYFLTALFLFTDVITSIINLTLGIRKEKGYQKNRLFLFLVSSSLGYLAGIPAYFLAFNIPLKPVTLPLVSLFPIILSYAIIRHRFLDIRKLIKNTLIFSLLFILLLGFASFTLFILREVLTRFLHVGDAVTQAIAIALALILYTPLKNVLSRLTQKLLYLHKENPETLFQKLSEDMFRYLKTRELAEVVTKRLAESLSLNRISFYARSAKTPQFFDLIASIGRVRRHRINQANPFIRSMELTREILTVPSDPKEFQKLVKKKIYPGKATFLKSASDIKEEAQSFLIRQGASTAFPIFFKDSLQGFLVMGHKKSDIAMNQEEFQILKSFVRHLSLAFNNTQFAEGLKRSYEEMSRHERQATAGAIISGIEHEVRTPLHVMSLSLTDLKESRVVSEGQNPEAQNFIRETMTDILNSANQIEKIIEHLSSLAARKPFLIEENVSASETAHRAIRDLIRDYPSVSIHSRIPDHLVITCDRNALYEIWVNLIKNACEACGENGEVLLDGEQKSQEIILSIKDNGMGISEAYRARIFEPFFTTKNQKHDGESGSGMGLFIVKENMDGLGGQIEVASNEGAGTCFKLHFPTIGSLIKEVSR